MKKKRINVIATKESFHNLSSFIDVEEVSDKEYTKYLAKCPTSKTITKTLKQNIKDINKRNHNENRNTPEENMEQANFVAHWVPERFVSFVRSFYHESTTIQELWKIVRQCNRTVNYTTGEQAFTKDQELVIGLQAMKEFVMKMKSEVNMKKGPFSYFNGIVNNLIDKLYFDTNFTQETFL